MLLELIRGKPLPGAVAPSSLPIPPTAARGPMPPAVAAPRSVAPVSAQPRVESTAPVPPPPPRIEPRRPPPANSGMTTGPGPANATSTLSIEPKTTVAPDRLAGPSPRPSDSAGLRARLNIRFPNIWYLIAGLVVVALLVWWAAFNLGHAKGRDEGEQLVRQIASDDPKSVPPLDPLATPSGKPADAPNTGKADPQPPHGSTTKGPVPAPPKLEKAPPTPAVDPPVTTLQAGMNYLVVATLLKRDAEESAAYLRASGLGVALLPVGGGVDPKGERAKDDRQQFEVVILRGMSPAQMRAPSPEISRLETQVKNLGRKWKAENKKAPTDFAQTFWRKHKGP